MYTDPDPQFLALAWRLEIGQECLVFNVPSADLATLSIDVSFAKQVQYLPVFVYSPENFLIIDFIKPADLFHSSPYPHFKGF